MKTFLYFLLMFVFANANAYGNNFIISPANGQRSTTNDSSVNRQPSTINPSPANGQRSTTNDSSVNRQPSTVNPSPANGQRSTTNDSSVNHQPSTVNPSPANGQRSTANASVNRQPSTVNPLNRPAFYKAMEESNKTLINEQLTVLETAPTEEKNAFMGTMLMKKAGVGGSPANKLKLFKEGRKMLEAAIKKEPDNAEYRFLRLMVQEHAPGVLGYKENLSADSEYIQKSYKSLPRDVQQAIADYSKKSKIIKLDVS